MTKPGKDCAFVGAGAASFATGPTLLLVLVIGQLAADFEFRSGWEVGGMVTALIYSSFICLIGSIPAAAVNAVVLGWLARRGVDQAVIAAISGGLIGLLIALLLFEIVASGRLNTMVALWFSATGALMGLLHWVIAIRPRRRWRLTLLRDEEAIRAME